MRETLKGWLKWVWGIVGTPIGYILVVLGLILFVLPGPGIPVLLLGLGILAEREHAWAKSARDELRRHSSRFRAWWDHLRGSKQ